MESTFSWNCLLQIKPLCIWKRYTVIEGHINKTYDQSNICKFTELLLVIANEQAKSHADVDHVQYRFVCDFK